MTPLTRDRTGGACHVGPSGVSVQKGQTTAHVTLDVSGQVVTASVTNEAVDELGLTVGMAAAAVIKASDVMIAVE